MGGDLRTKLLYLAYNEEHEQELKMQRHETGNMIESFRAADPRYGSTRDWALRLMKTVPLQYHDETHSLSVERNALTIAVGEVVPSEMLPLLSLAAIFHDTGYIVVYNKNEPKGAEIAENAMKLYGYSDREIAQVKDMIVYGTTVPQKPRNLLEKIMADADLANLGSNDFGHRGELLRLELGIEDRRAWTEQQIAFLKSHGTFFTPTANKMFAKRQAENLKALEASISRIEEVLRTS